MKKSGIYIIRNTINNNLYVGSSSNLRSRRNAHFRELRNNKHHCTYLQRSFLKYGKDVFVFSVLEYCENSFLIEKEQHYIDTLNPRYNICRIAGNCLGVRRTDETKRKLSDAHKGQIAWNKGIPRTQAEIENHRSKIKGKPSVRKGVILSISTKQKMSVAKKGIPLSDNHKMNLSKRIKEYTTEGKYIITHPSLTVAALSVGSSHSNLCRAMKYNKNFKNKKFVYE